MKTLPTLQSENKSPPTLSVLLAQDGKQAVENGT